MSSDENQEIVPFGKYRGQPLQAMLADQNYLSWVASQPGLMTMLQSRHPTVFNIITIGAPTTDETPEHNKLQARFLDEAFQYAFIELCIGKSVYQIAAELAQVTNTAIEAHYAYWLSVAEQSCAKAEERLREEEAETSPHPTYFEWSRDRARDIRELYDNMKTSPPPALNPDRPLISLDFECGYDLHLIAYWKAESTSLWQVRGASSHLQDCNYSQFYASQWAQTSIYRNIRKVFAIEIKPQMGDDFPAVLRQMKRNEADTLVIGAFQAASCNLQQVRSMFRPKRIITLSQIEELEESLSEFR